MATASPDGNAYTIGASGGYDFHAGRLTYGPVADVLATKAHVGGYVENESNDFGSTLQSRDRTSVRLGLGLQGEYALRDISWGVLSLTGSGKVVQELGDRRDRFQYAFTVDPTTAFQAQGPNTGVTYGAFDLGMNLAATDGLRVAVSYSPRFDGRGFVDQGASLSIRKTF